MWLCYQHKIHLIFLPPHTSHVLQPLDLSVFSSLKQAYRKEVGFLNLLTDSNPIGKQGFLLCYQKARKHALSSSNIKSGWKATGLWPVSSAKPLMSRLLLENSKKTKSNTANTSGTPETPLPISSWLLDSSQIAWSTPRRSKDLRTQMTRYGRLEKDYSTRKLLFRKIAKGFEEKETLLATAEYKIQSLEMQLEAVRPKKKKKVQTSPNSKFVLQAVALSKASACLCRCRRPTSPKRGRMTHPYP